ncbi:DMT family transporter [Niallia sp. 03133]|uniref:DMT family transporter n=1 Tax=Niallia sp. 03133 TaxID=3458060 RepID=UPI004044AB41
MNFTLKRSDLLLLSVAFILGSTFVIVQNAVFFLEPHAFNAIRFFITALFLFLWLVVFQSSEIKSLNFSCLKAGFILGFLLILGYASQTIGLLYTTSSKAGFITGLSVVLVPLFLFIFFKNKLSIKSIIGVLFAAVGLYLLTVVDTLSFQKGDFYVLICVISFALQIILTGNKALLNFIVDL